MENSQKIWKDSLKKSFTNTSAGDNTAKMLGDMNNYSKEMREEEEEEPKKTAKQVFAKDLQDDPDFHEFKKRAKYKYRTSEFSFGAPNVTGEDPYIKKKTKYGRPGRGKEESTEATGSGSSGAFSAPLLGGENNFMKKSNSEKPNLEESSFSEGMYGVEKIETKEATGSGSVGGYESPSMWAKSTSKKDWGPSRKTQYKGGSFVKVKDKCTKFPYCNQGDINALKLTKNESVKEAIKSVAKKLNLSEDIVKIILENEFTNTFKRK